MAAPPLYTRLAAAYVRGALRDLPNPHVPPELLDPPLDELGEADLAALVELGQGRSLRLHRFKRTIEQVPGHLIALVRAA